MWMLNGQNKFVKKAFIDYTASKPSADLTITKSEKNSTFTITAKNLQGSMATREVKIPFWSHANGMKDIIWYTPTLQADGSYTVTAKASDHENADGKYEAQVFYVDAQGQNKFVKKAFIDYKINLVQPALFDPKQQQGYRNIWCHHQGCLQP